MRWPILSILLLALTGSAFAQMLLALNSIASGFHTLVYVPIFLVIIGAFVYFKWKRKGVSILIFSLSCLLLLVPITSCSFLSTFVSIGLGSPCEFSCQQFEQGVCKAVLNAGALISSETLAFLFLLVGTALLSSSDEKKKKNLLIIGAILLLAGFIMLLFSAYLLNNGAGFACTELSPCSDYCCSKYA